MNPGTADGLKNAGITAIFWFEFTKKEKKKKIE